MKRAEVQIISAGETMREQTVEANELSERVVELR